MTPKHTGPGDDDWARWFASDEYKAQVKWEGDDMSKATPRKHLSQRLAERTEGVTPGALRQVIRHGHHAAVMSLTNTRRLCVAKIDDEVVWFIYSKQTREPVTVLPSTAHQVRRAIANHRHKVPQWARWKWTK